MPSVSDEEHVMTESIEEQNKAIVREAFETLFNKRDYAAAEAFWSPEYIQHSAHIPPGRHGLFELVRSLPATLRHELELIMVDGDLVMVRGRYSGHGQPANWIVVDVIRMQDGVLAEHWDVIEDEATRAQSVSGLPMFGESFPDEA
jgi:predicted SnoaL-like aldol condensation-catalyzing enzyme